MLKLKKSSLSFFKFIQSNIGIHFYLFIIVNALVGILDGLGLALFIPLLTIVGGGEQSTESLGKLKYFTDFLENIGIELNLFNVLMVMVCLFILKGIIFYLKSIYDLHLRLSTLKKIRFLLIDALGGVRYNRYTNYDSGTIQNTMTGQVGRLINAMINYFSTIQSLVMLFTYVLLAFFANWKFAVLVGIGGLLSNFIYKYINKITKEAAIEISKVGNRFNRYLIETIHNFKYLKATNYINIYDKNLRKAIDDSQNLEFKIGLLNNIANASREPIIIIIITAVILIQVNIIGNSFTSILVSLLFFYRALNYLVVSQGSWNLFINNSAGYNAISEVLNDFNNDKESEQVPLNINNLNKIQTKDISLSYGNKKVINNINLTIKGKETIALIGESGAGKTTLANIICGLIKPDEGNLIINNEILEEKHINSFRKKVGYITQDPVIFSDTIFNNITFWDEKSNENLNRFWKCIELVALVDFMNDLEFKEDTPLGNNGILVSGGQKQRISIARELYKNVELLIMDEATSALDSETENYIKENIENLQGQYTMVIIAHRLSTIKHADCIYLMDNGNIVEYGKYDVLYKESKKFRQMVDLQNLT